MGRTTQGETVLRNLICVQLKSLVGIDQRDLVQGTYLQQTVLHFRFWAILSLCESHGTEKDFPCRTIR